MKYPRIQNYFSGKFVDSNRDYLNVSSPVDGSMLSEVPLSNKTDLNQAVDGARKAFPLWSALTLKERSQFFYRYKFILEQNRGNLAQLVHEENGKTVGEANAEIDKAIEVTEFACSLPQMVCGDVLEVSPGVECRIDQEPLGVVASVTPFNFPIMVPHWTIPIALVLGNTFILKPSEKVPLSANRTAELLQEAGLPAGVFQVIHGDRSIVESICDHPQISAIAFVGSTAAARSVYIRATSHLKRALAMGGAKNHLIVLPDAPPEQTAKNITASMAGCAGQRCMAASVMIAVGEVDHIIKRVCEESQKMIPGKNIGPVISEQAKRRIENYITNAEQDNAKVLVDGRQTTVPGFENGHYIGATVIDHVLPEMSIATEEVFGPVLSIIRAESFEAAMAIESSSEYGNSAAIYTRDGGMAKDFTKRAKSGMIGVNIGVPIPREPFGFGGWNNSRFGMGEITGKTSIPFWLQSKKVTTRW